MKTDRLAEFGLRLELGTLDYWCTEFQRQPYIITIMSDLWTGWALVKNALTSFRSRSFIFVTAKKEPQEGSVWV